MRRLSRFPISYLFILYFIFNCPSNFHFSYIYLLLCVNFTISYVYTHFRQNPIVAPSTSVFSYCQSALPSCPRYGFPFSLLLLIGPAPFSTPCHRASRTFVCSFNNCNEEKPRSIFSLFALARKYNCFSTQPCHRTSRARVIRCSSTPLTAGSHFRSCGC